VGYRLCLAPRHTRTATTPYSNALSLGARRVHPARPFGMRGASPWGGRPRRFGSRSLHSCPLDSRDPPPLSGGGDPAPLRGEGPFRCSHFIVFLSGIWSGCLHKNLISHLLRTVNVQNSCLIVFTARPIGDVFAVQAVVCCVHGSQKVVMIREISVYPRTRSDRVHSAQRPGPRPFM